MRDEERTTERGRKVGVLGEFVRKRGNSRNEELASGEGRREVCDFRVGRGTTGIVGRLADRAGGEGCSGNQVTSSDSGSEFGRGLGNQATQSCEFSNPRGFVNSRGRR